MSAAKRISKKQIKEDKLVTTVFKASEYIQKNPTPFVISGVAVAAIFIAIVLMMWSADRKRTEAANLLARAHLAFDSGQVDAAISDLNELAESYSGTKPGVQGTFILANYNFQQKNYTEALGYYNKIIAGYDKDKMLLSSAVAGAAACMEIDGDRLQAAKLYMEAAIIFPDELWAPDYLFRAGANFAAAGDTASAVIAYSEIDSSYGGSLQANRARRSLAEIKY